jgi:hypothetical protein
MGTGATSGTGAITGGLGKPTGFIVRPVESAVSTGGAERLLDNARTATGCKPAAGNPEEARICEKNPPPESICLAAESVRPDESCEASVANASALAPKVFS